MPDRTIILVLLLAFLFLSTLTSAIFMFMLHAKMRLIYRPTLSRKREWEGLRERSAWAYKMGVFGDKDMVRHILHGTFDSADAALDLYLKRYHETRLVRTQHTQGSVSYLISYPFTISFIDLVYHMEIQLRAVREDLFSVCYTLPSLVVIREAIPHTIFADYLKDFVFGAASELIAGFEMAYTIDQMRAVRLVHPALNPHLVKDISIANEIADRMELSYWLLNAQCNEAEQKLDLYREQNSKLTQDESWQDALLEYFNEHIGEGKDTDIAQFAANLGIFAEKETRLISETIGQIDKIPPDRPRSRGRPSEPGYNVIFQLYEQGTISHSETIQRMMALGVSKDAATKALSRRKQQGRNSE